MSRTNNLDKAVSHIKRNREIRRDQLDALGVTSEQLRKTLKRDGFGFVTRDYSDESFRGHPDEIFLDLIHIEEDDGPGGIDY
ncbi:MAG: hypothetical protein ABSB00_00665 [Minisyncoccia bacterium]|jgi:hypothetical protein